MDFRAAADLIRGAVPSAPETWVDLGAGSGTFTIALASLLGDGAHVIAVDRDVDALEQLRVDVQRETLGARITVVQGDFRKTLDLPPLHGVLLANALHFVPVKEQPAFLRRVVGYLRPAGRLLVVDYDRRAANPWVPYPVSSKRLADMISGLGLPALTTVATQPSRYGGVLYAAYTTQTDTTASAR